MRYPSRRSVVFLCCLVLMGPGRAANVFALDGLKQVLDTRVTEGKVIHVEGPPSTKRDSDRVVNSVETGERILGPRRALPEGVYQTLRKNWLIEQNPHASLRQIAKLVRQRYDRLVLRHVHSPKLSRIDVEPLTLIYPPGYDGNKNSATVHVRRLTVHATDHLGDPRKLVAYYVNYDKLDIKNSQVLFQVNGHFGHNPSRQALGLEARGGYSGAALGKLAMKGLPLIVYDDHDVGESSPATGKQPGLFRTLENLRMMDDALLVHFDRVDALGLSGGCERLYHFLMFHRCKMPSAYLAGYTTSPWTYIDSRGRTGGPFGTNADTDNEVFMTQFQWADLVLAGIDKGIEVSFVNMTYEGGTAKNAFHKEILPALRRYTNHFDIRGDDPDCDGVSNNGKNLSHEYDLEDYLGFLKRVQLSPR